MSLEHRIPDRDAFFDLFNALYPLGLRAGLKRLPSGSGGNLGEVSAIGGKELR
ncbi:MAG: hypothetical protein OXI01_24100 [Albidovulum sp.]|nr:hypothetical protein [Albidovulum sp.]